jgi:hypothetical protein
MRPLGLGEHGDIIYGKRGRSVVAMVNYRDFSVGAAGSSAQAPRVPLHVAR